MGGPSPDKPQEEPPQLQIDTTQIRRKANSDHMVTGSSFGFFRTVVTTHMRHTLSTVTKSVVALLVGIAADRSWLKRVKAYEPLKTAGITLSQMKRDLARRPSHLRALLKDACVGCTLSR
jgi:hypothetical protein